MKKKRFCQCAWEVRKACSQHAKNKGKGKTFVNEFSKCGVEKKKSVESAVSRVVQRNITLQKVDRVVCSVLFGNLHRARRRTFALKQAETVPLRRIGWNRRDLRGFASQKTGRCEAKGYLDLPFCEPTEQQMR